MKGNKILDALDWRYATKKFNSDKKVSDKDLKVLLESARLSPTSFGLQPFKIFVITDKELREKIKAASWNQPQVTDASHFIILCTRKDINENYIKKYIKQISKVRETDIENLKGFEDTLLGFRKNFSDELISEWAKRQSYIALGFLLETAAVLGIDACPMEGFNSVEVDKILNLDGKSLTSAAFCALGYRSDEDEHASMKKVRFDDEDFFEFR